MIRRYRIWDGNANKYIYDIETVHENIKRELNQETILEVENLFLEEETGITDKSGTPIFENDNILCDNISYRVFWDEFKLEFSCLTKYGSRFSLSELIGKEIKVIGNIREKLTSEPLMEVRNDEQANCIP